MKILLLGNIFACSIFVSTLTFAMAIKCMSGSQSHANILCNELDSFSFTGSHSSSYVQRSSCTSFDFMSMKRFLIRA